jgi:hypothetical protein
MTATTFGIPTYRLRDVGETIERYDENFWRNGHSVPMIVFDDSSQATHEKYGSSGFSVASEWQGCGV